MRRLLAAVTLIALPLSALALDYTPGTQVYTDASSFTTAEKAAISVLTNAKAVSGNPDGSFRAHRTLNRAEFTKIAADLYIRAQGMDPDAINADPASCFPDVQGSAWYVRPVCRAKMWGLVSGNADGLFHPERPVNYAEAVKIMDKVFGYELPMIKYAPPGPQWYEVYLLAAQHHQVSLPIAPGDLITRGTMARLAAAFYAESKGELALYRAAERGETIHSSSSSRSSSSASAQSSVSSNSSSSRSSSSSVSSVSSSISSSSSVMAARPVRSHFLVTGSETPAIASATFTAVNEPVLVRGAEIKLERKINSIDAMFITDAQGHTLGQLTLDHLNDNTDKTWKGTFAASGAFTIPKNEDGTLAVTLRLKPATQGGYSEELVQVDTFRITAQGVWSQNSYNSAPQGFAFPVHQTAQANLTDVHSVLPVSDALPLGNNQVLAAFSFGGTAVPSASLRLEEVAFQVAKSSDIAVANWQLGVPETNERIACSVNGDTVTCSGIPDTFGTLTAGPRVLRLYGDVTLSGGAQNPSLQISINQPGGPGEIGAIHWTDGSAHFTWTDLDSPIARSTRFQ
jgi:hypothetical protein